MSIAQFSVSRPVAVTMRIAALVLLGAICLTKLPVALLPNVSLPTVAVITQWPNVAPEEIEAQITRPVEEAVSATPNMYQVSSSTMEGNSVVRVQFNWGTDIGQAAVDTLQMVERAERNFPTNEPTLQQPIVFKYDPNQLPILIFGVSGISDSTKLKTLLNNEVTPMLESSNGVASAVVTGGENRAIVVDIDEDRLHAHDLSITGLEQRIVAENVDLPAGIAKQGGTEYTVRSLGWFKTASDMAKMPVGSFNGQLVPLADVATVKDTHDETRLFTRLNGHPCVGVIITKQSAANTISTAKEVFNKLEKIQKLYPQLRWGLAYNQAEFVQDSVDNVRDSAVIGGVLAILILLFFLRNIRSTLVVALSIPTSIISTFALIYMCGFTINTMSLGGLALATGLIVDDAVVVLENIFRHIERDKKSARDAAVSGTTEIFSAVVASTWTVMVVFLPLLLIKGQAGQMYTQFALVVIFSLAVSLLDATTVVPMLATRLISGEAHHEDAAEAGPGDHRSWLQKAFHKFGVLLGALDSTYRNRLRWAIHHRVQTILIAIGITFASTLLVPFIGTELMPLTDSGDFSIDVKMPLWTALSQTNAAMMRAEKIVYSNPNVATAFSAAGSTLSLRGSTTTLIPYEGSITVKLKDKRNESTQQAITAFRKQLNRIPGVTARPTQTDLVTMIMTGGAQNIEVDIFGNDLDVLSTQAQSLIQKLRGVSGLENLDVNWAQATPEVQWRVDRDKALQMGVSFSDVANTIYTATNGDTVSYFQENGFQYPIIVDMPFSQRKTVSEMSNLIVRPSSRGMANDIMLSQVATPLITKGPSEITRMNRQRYIGVTGMPEGRSPGDIQRDVQKILDHTKLPAGYYWDWGLNQRQNADEFAGMGLAVFMAIALIYMLLASQFESFMHPLTILLSVPLAGCGVILGLFLTGRAFGLTSFIGVLMLVGIVVKNGILLVDYTNTLRGRGMIREEALLTAGPTRLRPILMTASAACLGMLPLALGVGKGSEVQAPMATAVIGGLCTSTILTLFVVPVVYSLLDDIQLLWARKKQS